MAPTADTLDRLLSTRSVCAWADLSDRNLRRLVQTGKFPRPDLTIGRQLRWKESTLRAWLADQESGR